MDQVKVGKFIAESRKKQKLTQMDLAERLGVTDRAVSKWETGKSMPDSSIMIELCELLEISVTELLKGEKVSMESNEKKFESIAMEFIKQKEESDRRLLMLEWVIAILSIIVLLGPICVAGFFPMEEWLRVMLIFSGFVPALIGFYFAFRIEQVAGYYECRCCQHKYVPSYKTVCLAMHFGRTRYMKCPKCGKKSWQRKVISKD